MRSLTYKFRLYPTEEQQAQLWVWSRALNDLYNYFVDLQRQQVVTDKPLLRRFDLNNLIMDLKTKIPHLEEVYADARQACSTVVNSLMTLWKLKYIKFPKLRCGYNFFTITYPAFAKSCKLSDTHFIGGKLSPIEVNLHRPVEGVVKTASIKCDADGKWWLCLSATLPPKDLNTIDLNNVVGIDMGCGNFLATSDGYIIKSPAFLKRMQDGIDEIQAKIDQYHKPTGSKKEGTYHESRKCKKLKKTIRRLYGHRTRLMKNFLHTRSHALATRYDVIVAENLRVKEMKEEAKAKHQPGSRNINRKLSQNSIAMFKSMLAYKSKKYIEVNPAYTSQTCSLCGQMSESKLTLADRTYVCTSCGSNMDRDINAALNIRNLGILQFLHLAVDTRLTVKDVSDQLPMCNTLYPSKITSC